MNDPSPESALAAVLALSEKATEGPWFNAGPNDDGTHNIDTGRLSDHNPASNCEYPTGDFIIAACNFIRTHGAHFAALAAENAEQAKQLGHATWLAEQRKARITELEAAYIDYRARAEHAEAERDAAVQMLREAVPFVAWTGCPDGMIDRICAILGDKGEGK